MEARAFPAAMLPTAGGSATRAPAFPASPVQGAPVPDAVGDHQDSAEAAASEPLAALVPWSGLALVLFLSAHLAGVSLALLDPAGFERLAAALHHQPWVPLAELLLVAALLLHPCLALWRSLRHRLARGVGAGSLRSRRGGGLEGAAALAGRWAPWSGGVLLLFLALHLAQLRLRPPPAGEELEAVLRALAPPAALALYVLAGLAVALHLLHGNESAHRSLGWIEPANRGRIRGAGRALALLLGAGFALLPLALLARASLAGWSP
jgi:succinate dehydrogenase / fumarate reductase cytochrome b subunit